ncbi:MAG TPA: SOS response-associated peptidase [Candidatus Marinimicrobia bacterium]|nr:SOS response-associated peptidase [Candidatus Neomarinimicrobiota bacterium]
MCGRKTLTKDRENIIRTFQVDWWEGEPTWEPHYNISPLMQVPVLFFDGQRIVRLMTWGLIPHWAKDEKIASKLINARAETLLQKLSFAGLVEKNRCIVITDGYYEWKKEGESSIPFYIKSKDDSFLPMAGLYDLWKKPEGNIVYTYTVITVDSNPQIGEIHHRMPAILKIEDIEPWINCLKYPFSRVKHLLKPYEHELEVYPVSKIVNYSRNNSPLCIKRIDYQ